MHPTIDAFFAFKDTLKVNFSVYRKEQAGKQNFYDPNGTCFTDKV